MTEKEERIEQFITIQQRTITTRYYETNDEIISEIYPRQEAIRKMCDAYFKAKDKGVMESERVEAALNALLEGGKNVYKTYNNVCSEK